MKVIDPGHHYELTSLDGDERSAICALVFVKREGPGFPGNKGHHSGTTMQEVLRALIDRMKYVNWQIHDWRNDMALNCLRMAIYFLEDRAAQRYNRRLPDHYKMFDDIENIVPCQKCLHIGCAGECHP